VTHSSCGHGISCSGVTFFFLNFPSEIGPGNSSPGEHAGVAHLFEASAREWANSILTSSRGGEPLNRSLATGRSFVPDTKLNMFDFQGAGEREKKKL